MSSCLAFEHSAGLPGQHVSKNVVRDCHTTSWPHYVLWQSHIGAPWVLQRLGCCEPFFWISEKKPLDKVIGFRAREFPY